MVIDPKRIGTDMTLFHLHRSAGKVKAAASDGVSFTL
jgi:hypothetical protein